MDLLHKGKRITIYARTEKKFKFVNSEMFFYLIQGYFKSPVINNGYISYAWIPASGAKYDLIVPEEGESYYPTGFPYE